MKYIYPFLIAIALAAPNSLSGQQSEDAFEIKRIYDETLTEGSCFEWLNYLSENIGGRLAGSPQAVAAAEYTKEILMQLGADSVWLQPCTVQHWLRGQKEVVRITNSESMGTLELNALSLGHSAGTGPDGLLASVVEVKSLDEVDTLGIEGIKGKIVFFNRPMDARQIRTFRAYGGAVDQRVRGPARASKYGAVAAIVRSMTTLTDDVPHTGVTAFREGEQAIPALAISTADADILSRLLRRETVRLYIENHCKWAGEKTAYNVIAEIRGSTFPEEIILVGGHLDSWDVGGGAHDDGAGCVHAMQVFETIQRMAYKPKRTLRCVLFTNEENGLAGARTYAQWCNEQGHHHLVAIESDSGGFTPRGFSMDAEASVFDKHIQHVERWRDLLAPYGLSFEKGGSGADITPLKSQKGLLMGFRTDSQRYFDYHHAATDRIQAVNARELALGAAAMTSMVFLIDKYGLH